MLVSFKYYNISYSEIVSTFLCSVHPFATRVADKPSKSMNIIILYILVTLHDFAVMRNFIYCDPLSVLYQFGKVNIDLNCISFNTESCFINIFLGYSRVAHSLILSI